MFKSYDDFINEARVQLKRKYTENYPAKHVYASSKVRNAILDSIKDGVVSKDEFMKIVQEAGASKSWVRKYSGFFNMNETEVSLSKYGMKIWKGINPTPITEIQTKNKIEEMQKVLNFDSFMNEEYGFDPSKATRETRHEAAKMNEAYAGTIGEIRFSTRSQAALYNCELTGQFSDGAWENSGPRDHWRFWGDLEGVHKTPTGIYIYPGKWGRKIKDGYNLTSLLQYVGGRMVTIARLSLMGYDDQFCRDCDGLMDIGGENWSSKPMDQQREILDRGLKNVEEMANKNSYWAKTWNQMKEIDTDRFLSIRYGVPELKKDLASIKEVMKSNPIYEK